MKVDRPDSSDWHVLLTTDGAWLTLGRGKTSDIVVADRTVSREHARVAVIGGKWHIMDEQSKYGTFVGFTDRGMVDIGEGVEIVHESRYVRMKLI